MIVPPPATSAQLEQLHQTYCRLTGQNLSLRFDRERFWFEFHRAGFTLADLVQVVRYLQKEIRHTRRNVGALKLSNLLQLDRFEEDLNISRVRLAARTAAPQSASRFSARLLCGRTGTRAPARPGTTAPTQSKTLSRTALNWRDNFSFTQISAQPTPDLSRYARSTSR